MKNQAGILEPVPRLARYLFFSIKPGVELATTLKSFADCVDGNQVVVGFGQSLVRHLGAAIDAAVGLGLQPDFDTAVGEMTHTGRQFEPGEVNRTLYDDLYRDVYLKMYRRLKPLYEDIRRITGYPKPPAVKKQDADQRR